MKARFKLLLADIRGTSAVEYGIICSMIVLAMFAALRQVGNENANLWNTVSQKTSAAIGGSSGS